MSEKPAPNPMVPQGATVKVKFKWPTEGGPAPVYANQFSLTASGTEFLLEFGGVIPFGAANRTPHEVIAELAGRPVPVVARILFSHESAKQLKAILDSHVQ